MLHSTCIFCYVNIAVRQWQRFHNHQRQKKKNSIQYATGFCYITYVGSISSELWSVTFRCKWQEQKMNKGFYTPGYNHNSGIFTLQRFRAKVEGDWHERHFQIHTHHNRAEISECDSSYIQSAAGAKRKAASCYRQQKERLSLCIITYQGRAPTRSPGGNLI